jgi:hypothetical protein
MLVILGMNRASPKVLQGGAIGIGESRVSKTKYDRKPRVRKDIYI